MINDESQGCTAKHLHYDGLHYYKFIVQFAGERIFKISEHLAKLLAKCLILSYAPFVLRFCPQRCRTCQVNKITCISRSETVTNNVVMLCRPVLTDRLTQSVTDRLLILYSIMLRHLVLCYSSCVQSVSHGIFLYICVRCKRAFSSLCTHGLDRLTRPW